MDIKLKFSSSLKVIFIFTVAILTGCTKELKGSE